MGHRVTAVARRPERLLHRHPNLTALSLDLTTDPEGLVRALAGHDVVLSTIGRGLSLRSGNLIQRSVPLIVSAMERVGPSRLLFLSALGVASTYAQAPWHGRLAFRTLLRSIYADKAAGDAIIRRSSLDWTLLYPVILTNRPATGRYVLSPELPAGGFRGLARADAAAAMLACVDAPTSLRQGLVISPEAGVRPGA